VVWQATVLPAVLVLWCMLLGPLAATGQGGCVWVKFIASHVFDNKEATQPLQSNITNEEKT